MSRLFRNGQLVENEWKILRVPRDVSLKRVRLPVGPVLVPASVWKAHRAELIHREFEHGWPLGVWLSADESADDIAADIDDFSVVAIDFDKFADGNSYMTARLLRERYGYTGELRAIGDVPQEKLSFLHQVGFDSVSVHVSRRISSRITGLFHFNDTAEGKLAAA